MRDRSPCGTHIARPSLGIKTYLFFEAWFFTSGELPPLLLATLLAVLALLAAAAAAVALAADGALLADLQPTGLPLGLLRGELGRGGLDAAELVDEPPQLASGLAGALDGLTSGPERGRQLGLLLLVLLDGLVVDALGHLVRRVLDDVRDGAVGVAQVLLDTHEYLGGVPAQRHEQGLLVPHPHHGEAVGAIDMMLAAAGDAAQVVRNLHVDLGAVHRAALLDLDLGTGAGARLGHFERLREEAVHRALHEGLDPVHEGLVAVAGLEPLQIEHEELLLGGRRDRVLGLALLLGRGDRGLREARRHVGDDGRLGRELALDRVDDLTLLTDGLHQLLLERDQLVSRGAHGVHRVIRGLGQRAIHTVDVVVVGDLPLLRGQPLLRLLQLLVQPLELLAALFRIHLLLLEELLQTLVGVVGRGDDRVRLLQRFLQGDVELVDDGGLLLEATGDEGEGGGGAAIGLGSEGGVNLGHGGPPMN